LELERVLLRATRGEIDSVGVFCQRLIEQQHPDELLIREAIVKGCINLYRPVDALAQIAQWQRKYPRHPQAIFLHGLIDYVGSNLQVPAAKFREVLEIDPQRSDARSLLAELLLDLGQPQEALPHLEMLTREKPADLARKARLGVCLDMMGRQDEAKELLDAVLKQQPTHPIALLERGKLALREADLDTAESFLQNACAHAPGDYAAHYQLLQCLRRKGKVAEVQAVQKKMGQIQEDSARIREITGKAMAAAPDNPALHAELGEIFLRSGATKEGVRWLQSALRLSPAFAPAHRALAEHYQGAGQLSRAADHRQKSGAATQDTPPRDKVK
jgi:tetratricopeptide (TPR) repeat protein